MQHVYYNGLSTINYGLMITTKTKRRIIIAKLEVNALERFKPFEIRLPANVKKVTGILVTTSAK